MLENIKQQIIELVRRATEVEISADELRMPPDPKMGDLSLACFGLAKILGQSPVETAKKLAEAFKHESLVISHWSSVEKAEAIGPYLNIFINQNTIVENILKNILKQKKKYGEAKMGKGETIMVEYSGPNPGKGFHIGHLRNTVLGTAIINLLRNAGYKVTPVNYLNDTGTHIAKVIWIYKKYYLGKEPKANRGEWLGRLYAEAEGKLAANPEIKNEISQIHRQLEEKDKTIVAIRKKINTWSLDDFNRIYKQLGAEFKKVYWDHDYYNQGKEIVADLEKKGIAEKSEGAVIVNLEKYNLATLVVLKSDGTALYITKDIAMAKERFEKHNPDKMIYIVGNEQALHFRQLFKILDLWGFSQAKNCYHLSYELVRLKEGKMSSRAGNVILYNELFGEALAKSLAETKERHPEWAEKKIKSTAEKISLAALKFGMLKQSTNEIITFDLDEALEFQGFTGPYLLYTVARINSIFTKYGTWNIKQKKSNFSLLKEQSEINLVKKLGQFPEVVSGIVKSNEPAHLARYLFELSQEFNTFYHELPVLKAEAGLREARLALIDMVKMVLERGLGLLGIETLAEM